jgi:hypothetical protein
VHELHIADTDLTDRTSVSSTRNHGAIRFSYLVHSQSVRETGVDMLALLDIAFILFHTALVIFNSVGWMFSTLRTWHLVSMALTLFSWFGLGLWYGWGYCICTDWHWQIRQQLGLETGSNSYIHFLIMGITGIDLGSTFVDALTLGVFMVSAILSIRLRITDARPSH